MAFIHRKDARNAQCIKRPDAVQRSLYGFSHGPARNAIRAAIMDILRHS